VTLKSLLLQHFPGLERTGLKNIHNAFEPWGTTPQEHPEEHPLAAIEHYRMQERLVTSTATRFRHQPTGQRVIVKDGRAYGDGNRDGRITAREQMNPPPGEVLDAAKQLAASYEPAYSVGAVAVIDGDWICEGPLSAAELAAFNGEGVPNARTALQRHLDFFDLETLDGIISLGENWRGWRRLGYGWFRALTGTIGAAVLFGRPFARFSIDIANIRTRRRTERSGIYDDHGDVDTAVLDACLAEFDSRTGGDRDKPIPQDDALRIVERVIQPRVMGSVSTRQFRSLFDLCTRLNQGRRVITANQLVKLFDGSLLYLAAATPGRQGRTKR